MHVAVKFGLVLETEFVPDGCEEILGENDGLVQLHALAEVLLVQSEVGKVNVVVAVVLGL